MRCAAAATAATAVAAAAAAAGSPEAEVGREGNKRGCSDERSFVAPSAAFWAFSTSLVIQRTSKGGGGGLSRRSDREVERLDSELLSRTNARWMSVLSSFLLFNYGYFLIMRIAGIESYGREAKIVLFSTRKTVHGAKQGETLSHTRTVSKRHLEVMSERGDQVDL